MELAQYGAFATLLAPVLRTSIRTRVYKKTLLEEVLQETPLFTEEHKDLGLA